MNVLILQFVGRYPQLISLKFYFIKNQTYFWILIYNINKHLFAVNVSTVIVSLF